MTDSSTMRDLRTTSPLLRLSSELRLMIYEYFFHGVVLRSEFHRGQITRTREAEVYRRSDGSSISYTCKLRQGTFRRYHNRKRTSERSAVVEQDADHDRTSDNDSEISDPYPEEVRDNFLSLLQVNQLLRKEATQTMYNHVHVILPGHHPIRHHLPRIFPNLLANITSLELAICPTDNVGPDLRRLPKLETLILDFRRRPKAQHIMYSLPPPKPAVGYQDSPDFREYHAACKAGDSPWRKHIVWIRERLARQQRVRILCVSQRSCMGSWLVAARTRLDTGIVELETKVIEYEYEEDTWLGK